MTSRLAIPTRKKKLEIPMPDNLQGIPMISETPKPIMEVTTIVMGKLKALELTVSFIGPSTHVCPFSNLE